MGCINQFIGGKPKMSETNYGNNENSGNRPKENIRVGNCKVAIWEQEGKNGKFLTVSTQRSYRDSNGEWKNTTQLRINDIPSMRTALQKAFEYAKINAAEGSGSDD